MNRRTISPLSTMLTSHRRVFNTLHQITVRLSKTLPLSLTDITGPFSSSSTNAVLQTTLQRRWREREWGIRRRESDEADQLERSIAKRRWIYRHDLYAKVWLNEFSSFFSVHVIYSVVKHVASNPYTKYRPYPTPAQFAASQDLISRTITFLRRELQIWEGLDVEVKL